MTNYVRNYNLKTPLLGIGGQLSDILYLRVRKLNISPRQSNGDLIVENTEKSKFA